MTEDVNILCTWYQMDMKIMQKCRITIISNLFHIILAFRDWDPGLGRKGAVGRWAKRLLMCFWPRPRPWAQKFKNNMKVIRHRYYNNVILNIYVFILLHIMFILCSYLDTWEPGLGPKNHITFAIVDVSFSHLCAILVRGCAHVMGGLHSYFIWRLSG